MPTRSRLTARPLALSLGLALAFATAPALAQSLVRPDDGSSNTLVAPERQLPGGGVVRNLPGSGGAAAVGQVETRAAVSGTITQNGLGTGPGQQTTLVGAVDRLQGRSGSLTTNAVVSGAITQTVTGPVGDGARPQTVSIGSFIGTIGADTASANGTAAGDINQFSSRLGGRDGDQTVDIGSVENAGGNSLLTNGLLTGDGSINQSNSTGTRQTVQIATIRNSLVQNAETSGVIAGQVNQLGSRATGITEGDTQRLSVGAITGSLAQTARTTGVLRSDVVQQVSGVVSQSIDIGSVNDVVGGGTVLTQAGADVGTITQTLSGRDGAAQTLSVGSVSGGAPTSASTRAQLDANVTQSNNNGGAGDRQRIAVGSVDNAQGRVDSEGIALGGLQQTIAGGGSGRVQEISIGAVEGSSGTVETRARVTSAVTQTMTNAGRLAQSVRVGSVHGTTGSVRTDVQVSGAIVQNGGTGGSTGAQSVSIGTVSAAPPAGVVLPDPS